MADQFKGLPMEDLIGGPLNAAVSANVSMARATSDFITEVGFEPSTDAKVPGAIRMVSFDFERPGIMYDKDGKAKRTIEEVKMKVPLLAIVPIPTLQIDTVDVVFDMEVKSSVSEKSSSDYNATLDATGQAKFGLFSVKVKVHGSVSSHKENCRSSDNSAKYHVEVHAVNKGMPEGLSRVLDIMASAAKPLNVSAAALDDKGEAKRDANNRILADHSVDMDGNYSPEAATGGQDTEKTPAS